MAIVAALRLKPGSQEYINPVAMTMVVIAAAPGADGKTGEKILYVHSPAIPSHNNHRQGLLHRKEALSQGAEAERAEAVVAVVVEHPALPEVVVEVSKVAAV